MRNPYEVLHTHEQRIVHVRQEVEALRLVIELLDEGEEASTFLATPAEGGGVVAFPVGLEHLERGR